MIDEQNPNHLIQQKSPYLLQHAYNPVDWYAWSDEAFARAKQENKPIFLSVGYSTCHWCHVMAHESFEDEQVAAFLNEHYIAIKVDREERPDVDHVYMMYCQALTGEGGWPLTVVMTPEGHPFFAGTYFPKNARYGRPGLLDILEQLHHRWDEEEDKLRVASEGVSTKLQPIFEAAPGDIDAGDAIHTAFEHLSSRFDSEYGGFGDAPKFPTFHQLLFLLRYYRYTGENEARMMVEKSLLAIARGGIFDHVGGGLARYSTDAFWRVPHFEKMLYDNALAVMTYAEAHQYSNNPRFADVVRKVIGFVEREMTSPDGAFYAAQDADSEGREGRFYVWRPEDIAAAIGEDDGAVYCAFYDITEEGNFEGFSVPNYIETDVASFAASRGWSIEELWTRLDAWNEKLYEWRNNRERPATDDKILTAWNALMAASLAKAGAVLGETEYVQQAQRALSFIEEQLVDSNGRLLARYRDGEAGILAYSDDYAYLVMAYLEVYQATLNPSALEKAVHWQHEMNNLFWTNQNAYTMSGTDAERLIATPVSAYDGATPSANSVAAYNLARLYAITGNSESATRVEALFHAFGELLTGAPAEHLFLLMAFLWVHAGSTEVVVAGGADEDIDAFLRMWHECFVPESVLLEPIARGDEASAYPTQSDAITLYVCKNFHCDRPEQDIQAALNRISQNPPRVL